MSLFSPLLIVCLNGEEAPVLAELARALGYPDAQVVTGFPAAVEALGARTAPPEYIIIDIGDSTSDVLRQLDEFAVHCEPTVRVVVIGAVNDITFYRDLKARGVLEYFTRPASAADIRPVLIASASSYYQAAAPGGRQGKVISFMSAASGDGASTLALNFAYSLAQDFQQPTVLVDMDYQFGLISKSLDLAAPFGIRELFDHPDRGLDQMLVGRMLVKYKEGLSIIAAPSELKLLPHIRPEVVRELIGVLRSQFAFVVVDVPHIWTDWTAATLTYSDHVMMVGQLWLRSLTHASRLLAAWHGIGIAREDVSLIINRSGAKFKEAITSQDFERICRHKIEAYINNDAKAITQAETNAKTLFETGQGVLQQQIRKLAQMTVTRYQGQALPEESPAAGGRRSSLLSLLDKRK